MDNGVEQYEPLPRWGHASVAVGNKVYMWGGRTEDFSEDRKKKLANTVEEFDCSTETWVTRSTFGTPPPGLYNNAYTVKGCYLYVYGGWDGKKAHKSLHRLDLTTMTWSELVAQNPSEAPPEMSGCGLVAYGSSKLVLFGGYGVIKSKEKKARKRRSKTGSRGRGRVGGGGGGEGGRGEGGGGEGEGGGGGKAEEGGEGEKAGAGGEKAGEGVPGEGGEGKETETRGEKAEGRGEGEGGGEGEKAEAEAVGEKAGEKDEREKTEEGEEKGEGAGGEEGKGSGSVEGEKEGGGEEEEKESREGEPEEKKLEEAPKAEATREGEGEEERKEEERREEEEEVGSQEGRAGRSGGGFTVYKRKESDEKGWTNEIKVFDIETNTWSSQPTSGSSPPPSVDFSFTCVDENRAVVFGGYQPTRGITNDTYLLDMNTWHWTKLTSPGLLGDDSGPEGTTIPLTLSLFLLPGARDGHTACVIDGAPRPQLLVSGGWDKNDQALKDLWILDVNTGLWRELSADQEVGHRFWHTVVVVSFSSRMRQVVMFGGCPGAPESHTTGTWAKLADTVILEMGKVPTIPAPFTNGDSTADSWVVVDVVSASHLGDPLRRMREAVLLTSFRAHRAEELLHDLTKRARGKALRLQSPTSVIPEEEEEEEEEVRPFWQLSMDEIQITGEEVGKGRWSVVRVAMYHGTRVAARCLYNRINSEENRKIFNECLDTAAKLRHPNLVSFIGAILDREPIIITELMPSSLRLLLEKNPLTYYQLTDIATDVAKALEFLHSISPEPVVHGELTGSSVLLEEGKGLRWRAKLSDFMTAKYFHQLMSSLTPAGSTEDVFSPVAKEHPALEYKRRSRSASPFDAVKPRASPDRWGTSPSKGMGTFMRKASSVTAPEPMDPGKLSPKRDVYSFGILLVEMSTRTAVLEVSLQYLIESIRWPQVTTLVKRCLAVDPKERPAMSVVLSSIMKLALAKPS